MEMAVDLLNTVTQPCSCDIFLFLYFFSYYITPADISRVLFSFLELLYHWTGIVNLNEQVIHPPTHLLFNEYILSIHDVISIIPLTYLLFDKYFLSIYHVLEAGN